jgi:hypothetical protein
MILGENVCLQSEKETKKGTWIQSKEKAKVLVCVLFCNIDFFRLVVSKEGRKITQRCTTFMLGFFSSVSKFNVPRVPKDFCPEKKRNSIFVNVAAGRHLSFDHVYLTYSSKNLFLLRGALNFNQFDFFN